MIVHILVCSGLLSLVVCALIFFSFFVIVVIAYTVDVHTIVFGNAIWCFSFVQQIRFSLRSVSRQFFKKLLFKYRYRTQLHSSRETCKGHFLFNFPDSCYKLQTSPLCSTYLPYPLPLNPPTDFYNRFVNKSPPPQVPFATPSVPSCFPFLFTI